MQMHLNLIDQPPVSSLAETNGTVVVTAVCEDRRAIDVSNFPVFWDCGESCVGGMKKEEAIQMLCWERQTQPSTPTIGRGEKLHADKSVLAKRERQPFVR
jgi:hypothetical protein